MNDIITVHPDQSWTTSLLDGYVWKFAGTWHAIDSNDAGEPYAPEGHGKTPEAAVEDLIDQIVVDDYPDVW